MTPGGGCAPAVRVSPEDQAGRLCPRLRLSLAKAGPTYTPDVSPVPRGTRERPLRGRAAEVAAIGARLDEVRSGVGSVIIVEGRAGLGKTRLLEACASMAAERSFRVGRGVAEPHRRAVELDVLFDALFGGDEPLLARNALSDLHASPEQRFWLLQDIQALIEKAALRGPLLICLDDLHWAGEGCAVAMRQLPQQLASLPVGWVMAFRPNQGPPVLQSAKDQLEDAGAEVIRLGPLRREAVTEIATDVLGAEPDDDLLRKADQVRGDPFLLIEFFRGPPGRAHRDSRSRPGEARRRPHAAAHQRQTCVSGCCGCPRPRTAWRRSRRRWAGGSPCTSWPSWPGCRSRSCWTRSRILSRLTSSPRAATGWHSGTT